MLDDTARKLLRIMFHFSNHHRRMPVVAELVRLSGRNPTGVYSGLQELLVANYISWEPSRPVETAVILVAWEEPEPGAGRIRSGHWTT